MPPPRLPSCLFFVAGAQEGAGSPLLSGDQASSPVLLRAPLFLQTHATYRGAQQLPFLGKKALPTLPHPF